jgi:hypothetical protein
MATSKKTPAPSLTPEQEQKIREQLGLAAPSVFDALPGVGAIRHRSWHRASNTVLSAGLGAAATYFLKK